MEILNELKFDEKGLIPAIVQDFDNNEILMLAYMNKESLEITIETEQTCFFSRSRQELWVKGATSGNTQKVKEIRFDCDADTLLVKVIQKGAACHTMKRSCFFRGISEKGSVLEIE
ncbi:phosphoribosyl-AMP cyclohydrolase [candidate division KSB1 bacterium]